MENSLDLGSKTAFGYLEWKNHTQTIYYRFFNFCSNCCKTWHTTGEIVASASSAIEFGRKESFTKINEVLRIVIYAGALLREGEKGRCSPLCKHCSWIY